MCFRKTHWIPTVPRKIEKPTSLKVVSKIVPSEYVERITLEIKGPDHMGLIISPKTNVEFVKWSLNEDGPVKGPMWNGQDTYFVYYACSSNPEPWIVSLDFKVGFNFFSYRLFQFNATGLQIIKFLRCLRTIKPLWIWP